MKKMIAALVAALLMVTMIVPAMAEIQLGQVVYAAHGTKCFAVITVAMDGDKIADAYIDEFQMLTAGEAVGVPNSEAMIPVEGQVLASKRVNAEMYSNNMKKAGSTVAINANFDAIEAHVTGKTVAELEAEFGAKTAEEAIDAVAGCTLADTLGYVNGIIAAAKTVK